MCYNKDMAKKTYLSFLKQPRKIGRKTDRWKVLSNISNIELGEIYFYNHWRKYVFLVNKQIIIDTSCMKEIIDFVNNAMENR